MLGPSLPTKGMGRTRTTEPSGLILKMVGRGVIHSTCGVGTGNGGKGRARFFNCMHECAMCFLSLQKHASHRLAPTLHFSCCSFSFTPPFSFRNGVNRSDFLQTSLFRLFQILEYARSAPPASHRSHTWAGRDAPEVGGREDRGAVACAAAAVSRCRGAAGRGVVPSRARDLARAALAEGCAGAAVGRAARHELSVGGESGGQPAARSGRCCAAKKGWCSGLSKRGGAREICWGDRNAPGDCKPRFILRKRY